MGSAYDVALFRDTQLPRFLLALEADGLGAEVPAPWAGPSGVTVAEVETATGRHVVLVAPPMRSPRGIDRRLASRLGTEALFATVWDAVSVYNLEVVGDGVDRSIAADPEEGGRSESGARLAEEPRWPELDEAYVQTVFTARTGFDPGNIGAHRATWFSFGAPSAGR